MEWMILCDQGTPRQPPRGSQALFLLSSIAAINHRNTLLNSELSLHSGYSAHAILAFKCAIGFGFVGVALKILELVIDK